MNSHKMFNYEKRDFPPLKNGEQYSFHCTITSDGVPCMNSITGHAKMGVSTAVFGDGERIIYPTPNNNVILKEIKVGDFIAEYDYTAKRLRLRSFKICNITGSTVIALGADELFTFL